MFTKISKKIWKFLFGKEHQNRNFLIILLSVAIIFVTFMYFAIWNSPEVFNPKTQEEYEHLLNYNPFEVDGGAFSSPY